MNNTAKHHSELERKKTTFIALTGDVRGGVYIVRNLIKKKNSRFITTPHCIMMTSSNGDIFRVTGHLCGEFTGPGEFPAQRPVTRRFDVFFDPRLNKQLSKQS